MTDAELVAALAEAVGRDRCRDGIAAALLPVVRHIAEQRAAEELLAAVAEWAADEDLIFDADNLRARAAALTATPNHGTDAT